MNKCLSPEEHLLTLAARIDLGAEDRSLMEAILKNGVGWPRVMLYAKRFSIEPLLYRHLSMREHSRYVPDEVSLALKKAYRFQALRNMRIQGCIHQILKAMNENDIPVILLKGAAFLATHLYPDIALRPMNDIDILLRRENIVKACDLLTALGYDPPEPHAYQSRVHEVVSQDLLGNHLPPIINRKIARIEIHSNINGIKDRTLLPDLIWRKSIEQTMEGYRFRSLHTEHQILYLCSHLRRHIETGPFTLCWFCDIHELVRKHKETIQWESLFHLAAEAGVENRVKMILGALREKWGTPVPEVCGDGKELSLFEPDEQKAQKAIVKAYYRYLKIVSSINGWGNRIAFMWRAIFPSRENMVYRYHPRGSLSLCLCYILHPLIRIWRVLQSLYYHGVSFVRKVS